MERSIKEVIKNKIKLFFMKKLLVCDLENTLIKNFNVWREINKRIGLKLDYELYEDFVQDKITYDEWCQKLSFYHNFLGNERITEEVELFEIVWNAFRPYKGSKEFILKAKEKDYKTLLITGGIEKQALLALNVLGLDDYVRTNKVLINDNGFNIIPSRFGFNKEQALKDYCRKENVKIKNVVCVGDSDNDVSMLEFVVQNDGKSFLINPSKRIIFENNKHYVRLNNHKKLIDERIRILKKSPLENYEHILSYL